MRTKKIPANGGSQTRFRQQNIKIVINKINQDGPITKKQISQQAGLSFAKVNSITMQLNALGIISETGKADSSGGRPSAIYEVNPEYRLVIGCELSHKKIHTIVSTLKGEILSKRSQAFNVNEGKDALVEQLITSIRNEIEDLKENKEKLVGIGIAVAGLVNPQTGMATPFPHLVDWGDIPLKKIVENEFGLYCNVENVANAAALAELNYGVAKEKSNINILALNVGSGLGLGIIMDGRLYKGETGSAGEFGHITVDENGPLCMCGNVGCLETLASTSAIVKKARRMIDKQVVSRLNSLIEENNDDLTFKMICSAAFEGDKLAYSLLDEMGNNLGEGIVTLINLLNPKMIIVGGEVCCAQKIILQPMMSVIQRRALEIPRKESEIVFSDLGGNAGILGSTVPVIEHFFAVLPEEVAEQSTEY